MPEYTFLCDGDDGGCGHAFSIVMSVAKYTNAHACPSCKQAESVRRALEIDLPTINGDIRKGNGDLTVEHLAKRNGERMGDDEKAHLTYEHNKYKYEEPTRELPKGMTRMKPSKQDAKPGKKKKARKPNERNKSK